MNLPAEVTEGIETEEQLNHVIGLNNGQPEGSTSADTQPSGAHSSEPAENNVHEAFIAPQEDVVVFEGELEVVVEANERSEQPIHTNIPGEGLDQIEVFNEAFHELDRAKVLQANAIKCSNISLSWRNLKII